MPRSHTSAALLMFRRENRVLEVLLVHPGGPFWAKKDEGAWTIPKGEAQPEEDLIERAKIEFAEELGIQPEGRMIDLGTIRQKGGKTVYAWAIEGTLPAGFTLHSNTFEMEWPPRSGKQRAFPEVDRAEFFEQTLACRKINAAQAAFIDRLSAYLNGQPAS